MHAGPPIVVLDATGLSAERLEAHLDAAAARAAAVADRAVLLWLVDGADVVAVARRGWLVDRVGTQAASSGAGQDSGTPDGVADRLALLNRTLPVVRTVRVPDDVGEWPSLSLQ